MLNIAFNIISLGRQKSKDRIYQSAALGYHEEASLHSLFFITLLVATGIIFAQIDLYKSAQEVHKHAQELHEKTLTLNNRVTTSLTDTHDANKTSNFLLNPRHELESIKNAMPNKIKSSKELLYKTDQALTSVMLSWFLAIFLIMSTINFYIRTQKINLIITAYNQSIKIIAPHIDQASKLILEQRFALMQTQEDYTLLSSDINNIAQANNVALLN